MMKTIRFHEVLQIQLHYYREERRFFNPDFPQCTLRIIPLGMSFRKLALKFLIAGFDKSSKPSYTPPRHGY